MADLTTLNNAMKTVYLGPIRDQIYSNSILLDGCRRRSDGEKLDEPNASKKFRGIKPLSEGIDYMGQGFKIPLHTSGNHGVGSRAEGALLPQPGSQGYETITDTLRWVYGGISLTGQALRLSSKNEGSFIRALTSETKGLVDDLRRAVTIDAYTFRHGSGVLAGTSPVATVRTSDTGVNVIDVDTTRYVRIGDVVNIRNHTNGATPYDARLVTAVDPTNRTITIAGTAVNVTADWVFVRASVDSTAAAPNDDWGQSTNGLANIVDDTSILHGLNPATPGQGFWASTDYAPGTGVTDAKMRHVLDEIGVQSGSDESLLGIWTRGLRNDYANTLVTYKRFNDESSVKLRGGYTALMFDEKPMVVDDYCQNGTIYFLNTDDLFWAEASDFEWMEEDGAVLNRVDRRDMYTAQMFKYHNLGTTRRNAHGKITGLTDSSQR